MFIGLLIFFMAAAGLTAIVKQIPRRIRGGSVATVVAPKSYAGVDDFETAEGGIGVTFGSAETPDGPAEKAGMVGGDIITTWMVNPYIQTTRHNRRLCSAPQLEDV